MAETTISARAQDALRYLFPTDSLRPDGATWLVDQLVDAELHRRGLPDQVSGAWHALALTQGTLLKEEYDLGTHGHAGDWTVGAVVVDPVELTLFNMRYGFAAGDAALRAMVKGMQAACPRGKVVRTHTDGFAVLLGPTAEQKVDGALVDRLRDAMTVEVHQVTPDDGKPRAELRYTTGCLEVTVVDPPNWQLLGPLLWSECERALVIARRKPFTGVLARRFELDGRLPEL